MISIPDLVPSTTVFETLTLNDFFPARPEQLFGCGRGALRKRSHRRRTEGREANDVCQVIPSSIVGVIVGGEEGSGAPPCAHFKAAKDCGSWELGSQGKLHIQVQISTTTR